MRHSDCDCAGRELRERWIVPVVGLAAIATVECFAIAFLHLNSVLLSSVIGTMAGVVAWSLKPTITKKPI